MSATGRFLSDILLTGIVVHSGQLVGERGVYQDTRLGGSCFQDGAAGRIRSHYVVIRYRSGEPFVVCTSLWIARENTLEIETLEIEGYLIRNRLVRSIHVAHFTARSQCIARGLGRRVSDEDEGRGEGGRRREGSREGGSSSIMRGHIDGKGWIARAGRLCVLISIGWSHHHRGERLAPFALPLHS